MSTRRIELMQVRILPKPSLPAGRAPRGSKLARQAETFAALYDPRSGQPDGDDEAQEDGDAKESAVPALEDGTVPDGTPQPAKEPEHEQKQDGKGHPSYSPAHLPSRSNDPALLSSRIVRACAGGEESNLRMEYLASVVAKFCNSPSIAEGGGWELRIGLNPSVLAETKLFLQLSSYRLLLRFETENPRSKSLIYDNIKELGTKLHSLMGEKIDVEVTVW